MLAGLLGVLVIWGGFTYNRLVGLDQSVRAQWGQVENVYQRRLDLIPNLVETVKGAAAFERDTFSQVAQARAQAGQLTGQATPDIVNDAQALERFQQAQQQLGSALSRLMVVVERYPELRATESFRTLQAQLEGSENRIAVERMRYNEAAQAFNTARSRFPAVLVASLFGNRFAEKAYFQAQPGAQEAPKVRF
ncbi:LemA family protein [Vitiosangium sp. GDMCC 1.1324]|nr:LemA family protein [Vitiosangium sp. GDMCC 1.1324]